MDFSLRPEQELIAAVRIQGGYGYMDE